MDLDTDVLAELTIAELKQHRCAYAEISLDEIDSGTEISRYTASVRAYAKRNLRCTLDIKSLPNAPERGVRLRIVPVRLTGT
ncbi:hypothetical protein EXS65_04240 [Candidatus Peribacteria bacterium]|nr:hypothetical protein [Candidatus Peribacteria bacterium]